MVLSEHTVKIQVCYSTINHKKNNDREGAMSFKKKAHTDEIIEEIISVMKRRIGESHQATLEKFIRQYYSIRPRKILLRAMLPICTELRLHTGTLLTVAKRVAQKFESTTPSSKNIAGNRLIPLSKSFMTICHSSSTRFA